MAEIDLIQINTENILNILKTAYYDQTGETIQIGSNEFASSAVQSYVWSVLLNNINEATRNRFIDSARGAFLDAIASNYGIDKRPDGYHSSAVFELNFYATGIIVPAGNIILQDASANRFTNTRSIIVDNLTMAATFQAIEPGSKNNGIPIGEINIIYTGFAYITSGQNTTVTTGGTDGYPYTTDGDNAYREWLKIQIQTFSGAGTYQAYQSKALNADIRVLDAYVLRQDDFGYEKGKVKVYIYVDYIGTNVVKDIVQAACDNLSFRPVGDLVIVDYSRIYDYSLGVTFQVTFPEMFKGTAAYFCNDVLITYQNYLKKKINRPFVFAEFCDLMTTKNELSGMYAIDCKPLGLSASDYLTPIYPSQPGNRIKPVDILFDIKYK